MKNIKHISSIIEYMLYLTFAIGFLVVGFYIKTDEPLIGWSSIILVAFTIPLLIYQLINYKTHILTSIDYPATKSEAICVFIVILIMVIGFLVASIFFLYMGENYILAVILIILSSSATIILAWGVIKKSKMEIEPEPVVIELKKYDGILVEEFTPGDDELLEEWVRTDEFADKDLQYISAIKWDCSSYAWSLNISAFYWIRQEPFESILYEVVSKALNDLPGVKHAGEEDRERWAVDGETSGEELIRTCAVAVDKFLLDYRDQWVVACDKNNSKRR